MAKVVPFSKRYAFDKIEVYTMTRVKRRQFLKATGLAGASVLFAGCRSKTLSEKSRPNIVFIMADDMGYGDPGCYNPDSKIPTPNIDRLAEQGLRFTNAHSPGSLCIPARYGLLTGRYPFRSETEITGFSPPALIEAGRMTIGSLLQKNGYHTACIGKWHLGFENIEHTDYHTPLIGGPCDRGFDDFFGMHASLDIPPYYYIRNRKAVHAPTDTIAANHTPGLTPIQGKFWRAGKIAPGFEHHEVLPTFTNKAIDVIKNRDRKKPFFLYLALAAPHTPWLPSKTVKGTSQAGLYGDFTAQVDNSVGRVLQTLDELGLSENTLVFFTSDNGPVWYKQDEKQYDHKSTYFLRGMKADAFEGGHRMPFIARWPGHIPPGKSTDEIICFTDMLATFASLVGDTLPADAGEDSYDILPVLLDKPYKKPLRQATVIEDNVIIQGEWKLIIGSGYGGISVRYSPELKAKRKQQEKSGKLFNIKSDPSERNNLYHEHPEIVKRLTALLHKIKKQDKSDIRQR